MIVKAFNDVDDKKLIQSEDVHGSEVLDNIAKMQVGFGTKAFKADESGIWLGANKWADAPFRVDMEGNVVASSATFSQYATDSDLTTLDGQVLKKAGSAQPLTGDIRVGSGANVKIDGANARIIINDGSNDRILIGYQSGGF